MKTISLNFEYDDEGEKGGGWSCSNFEQIPEEFQLKFAEMLINNMALKGYVGITFKFHRSKNGK